MHKKSNPSQFSLTLPGWVADHLRLQAVEKGITAPMHIKNLLMHQVMMDQSSIKNPKKSRV